MEPMAWEGVCEKEWIPKCPGILLVVTSLKGHSYLDTKGLSYLSLRIQKMNHKTQVLWSLSCPKFLPGVTYHCGL